MTDAAATDGAATAGDLPVIIVGGGITGLSAAWELQTRGVPFVLLEAGDYLGGKLHSERTEDGFLVERTADAFILGKPYAAQLARDVPHRLLVLGRGLHAGVAAEVALKFQETAGLAALPFSTAEFAHGPARLADPMTPALFFQARDATAPFTADTLRTLGGYGTPVTVIGAGTPDRAADLPTPDSGHLLTDPAVSALAASGDPRAAAVLRVLGDGEPKTGAHGKPVLFLHPKDFTGTLVELEQA